MDNGEVRKEFWMIVRCIKIFIENSHQNVLHFDIPRSPGLMFGGGIGGCTTNPGGGTGGGRIGGGGKLIGAAWCSPICADCCGGNTGGGWDGNGGSGCLGVGSGRFGGSIGFEIGGLGIVSAVGSGGRGIAGPILSDSSVALV